MSEGNVFGQPHSFEGADPKIGGEEKTGTGEERVPMCGTKENADREDAWREYRRLMAEREELIAAGTPPEDLVMPLKPRTTTLIKPKDWKDERFSLPGITSREEAEKLMNPLLRVEPRAPLMHHPEPKPEYVWDGAKGSKDSNPKEAFGSRKAGLSTVSTQVKYEIGLAMLEGALKYGRHNYRIAGVRASTYYDACGRHMDAWWEGEDIDPHSGAELHHITKAIAGLTVLRDSMLAGNWTDDRPPRIEPRDWMERYNAEAEKMVDATETPKAPYTEKEHGK
jgi:hypothetical protein